MVCTEASVTFPTPKAGRGSGIGADYNQVHDTGGSPPTLDNPLMAKFIISIAELTSQSDRSAQIYGTLQGERQ